MRKFSFLLALMLLASNIKAQYVSLSNTEVDKLKTLVNTDQEIKSAFAKIQRLSDQAVNESPNPIDTIRTEGLLKGDPKKAATTAALPDINKMYAMALVFRLYGDKETFRDAVAYLTGWAKVNFSRGDPIDDTNLDGAIQAFDLLKDNIKPADKSLIVKWLTQVADAESNTLIGRPDKTTAKNNWNSHRLKIIGEIAWATDNKKLQQFVNVELIKQIGQNLNSDGTSIDFKLRDALHYHVYDLEALLQLCIVLKRATGTDYYSFNSATQSSVKKSVEWLLPYVTGEKKHAEFVNSTVRFDQQRAKNNEADYIPGTVFNPANGLKTLALAAYFDRQYYSVIKNFKRDEKGYPGWQLALNKLML